ncbi:hypothetical protein [Streptomyces asiaticus]
MTRKFRTHDGTVRDSKRKDKATTLARREVRRQKYGSTLTAAHVPVSA